MASEISAQHGRISVRATTEDDLELVLQWERAAENRPFICHWTPAQHREAIAGGNMAHWMIQAEADGRAVGYAILNGIGSPDRSLEFARIVIAEKGQGYGREALQLVKREAFERLGAHRVWLDAMEHNERARHLYRSEGFVEEGTLRECMRVGNRFLSLVILSMLENEYWAGMEARRGRGFEGRHAAG